MYIRNLRVGRPKMAKNGQKWPKMSDISYGLSYTPTPVLKTLYIDIKYHCKVSEAGKENYQGIIMFIISNQNFHSSF